MLNLFSEGFDSTFASITGLGAAFSAVENRGNSRIHLFAISGFGSVAAATEMAPAGEYFQRRNIFKNKEYKAVEFCNLLSKDIDSCG